MPFTLFVPPLGTRLVLAERWDFQLFNEHRNATLMALLGDARETVGHEPTSVDASLPAGTELIIDRYYIKQNLGDFDSVSFRIAGANAVAKSHPYFSKTTRRQVRFWAKLSDVNRLSVELVPAKPEAR